MKKSIFVILLVILLTGCTSEYNLTFDNNGFKEEIKVTIPENYKPTQTAEEIAAHIEADDQITPFINEPQYPFEGDTTIKYDKKSEKSNGNYNITLKHDYTHEEFMKAKTFRTCFKNSYFKENKNDYQLHMSGKFFCLYTDKLTINITTNNKVKKHNADEKHGNTYTWHIDKNNIDNVTIDMKISKTSGFVMPILEIAIGVGAVVILVMLGIAFMKLKNRSSVNEI